ncbi:hypothetical protein HZA43_03190 [Candidatus Peregrinibacteria bacterium]|nr:hypothetical protein [Candidatus Peregrinibacteria bacterium]
MRQEVFILGASGKVGRTLLRQIAENDVPELRRHVNPTAVVGLANSKGFLLQKGGFPEEALRLAAASRDSLAVILALPPQQHSRHKGKICGLALRILQKIVHHFSFPVPFQAAMYAELRFPVGE